MNKLNILDIIQDNKCAFLCGNGFSMNFDTAFSEIYDNLYLAHKDVIYKSQYKVKSNTIFMKKCNENYKSVLRHLRFLSNEGLMKIFEDAVLFAESIRSDKQLISEFEEKGIISKLTFGLSEFDPLNQICEVYKSKGIQYVNIENWTILIYFYAAIVNVNSDYYKFPINNSFITALKLGSISEIKFSKGDFEKTHLFEEVIFNGFTTYFRMLFSISIFSKGKAVNFNDLDGKDNLDLIKLKQFLGKFDLLITLNYDKIMEFIVGGKVEHLHGEYVINKEEYVYNQSLGMKYKDEYISFSDILIGDYFVFKSFLPIVNKFSSKRNSFNKQLLSFDKQITNLIYKNSISTILIFGMNIENDQHVLRNLMLAFYDSNVENPSIIYSYFSEREKQEFEKEFHKVITFSKEVNDYCKNIRVSFIRTQDILSEHFNAR